MLIDTGHCLVLAVYLIGFGRVLADIPDPVYHWSFDEHCIEDCGKTCINSTIPDGAGFAFKCPPASPATPEPYVDGIVGQGLRLTDGLDQDKIIPSSDDRCVTTLDADDCPGLTVVFWLQVHSVTRSERSIFESGVVNPTTRSLTSTGVAISVTDEPRLQMRAQDSGVSYYMNTNDTLMFNAWQHVGFSWKDNQPLKTYINGTLVNGMGEKKDKSPTVGHNYITLGSNSLDFTIDELKIWSQEFTSENMSAIFQESSYTPTTTPEPTTTQSLDEETTQPEITTQFISTTTKNPVIGTTPPLYATNPIPQLKNISEELRKNQLATKDRKYKNGNDLQSDSEKLVSVANSLTQRLEEEDLNLNTELVVSFIQGVSSTTNSIMASENAEQWRDVPDNTKKLNNIIEASDIVTEKLIEAIAAEDIPEDVQIVTEETFVVAFVPKIEADPILITVHGGVQVDLPVGTVSDLLKEEPVVLAANVIPGASACYNDIPATEVDIFEQHAQDEEVDTKFNAETPLQILTEIVSINIRPDLKNGAVRMTFKHTLNLSANLNYTLYCAYINKTSQKWTNEQCNIMYTNDTHTTVETFHLTNFAILMQVVPFEIPPEHLKNLSLITYIGSAISIFCLVLSLCIFALVNNIRGNRTERYHIHANLALAMLLGQVSFLVGADYLPKTDSCKATAILLHFFYMSAFTWMLVEGLHLYNLVVKVFRSANSRLGYYYMIGWGTSLLICVISVAAAYSGYGENKTCWLDMENTKVIWAFAGPALFVILVNICILIKVTRIITNLAKSQEHCINCMTDRATIAVCAKAIAVLMPILGVTWLFGVFAVNQHTIVFQYIFAVCNSLQGFFLFMFHCVFNTETRSSLKYRTKSIRSDLQSRSVTQSRSRRQTKVELVRNAETVSGEAGETASTAFNTNNNNQTQYTPYGTPATRRVGSGIGKHSPGKIKKGFQQLHNDAADGLTSRPASGNSGRFPASSRKIDPSVSTAW